MTKGCNSGVVPSRRFQRSRDFMKHYYDYTSRLFSDGRTGDYLNELFLNAAKNGDYERVQNFLARTSKNMAVNVDAKEKETGHTAVMLAAMNQHFKVVSLLLNYGADITLCNNNGQSILDLTADAMRPLLLGSVARQGFSSRHLLQAAWQGNLPLVKKLLSSNFNLDVNCTNADGLTPLLLVTRDLNLFEKIEKAVMENGYHPVEVVKELLQHKADITAKDSEGKRPLHFVAHGKGSNAKSVTDILIQNCGRNIDVPDGLRNSPLHCASKDDNQPILLALIKGGADVNVRGHVGRTPLHVAASQGHETSSGMLLEHGADVTITDDNGLSPVDVAKGRRVQMVLTEAWAEQTKDNKMKGKRIFSAPTSHITETESNQTEASTESQDASQTNNTTSQTKVQRKLKKRSKSSIGSVQMIEERTIPTPPRKESDLRMPRIPSAQKSDSNLSSKSSSTFIAKELSGKKEVDVGRKEKHQAVMLPRLSVLNIQLSFVRNLRGDRNVLRAKMAAVHQPSPPRHRLRHRLSSPVLSYPRRLSTLSSQLSTPGKDKDERLRSSSMSQVPDYAPPSRLAVPCRVPPLGLHRVLTPELRSLTSPYTVQEMLPVVDLDLLRKVGYRGTNRSTMMSPEIREVTPPPPSPRTGTESPLPSGENKNLDVNSLETANEFAKTQTFSSIPRSTFWIPVGNDIENKTDTNGSEAPIAGKELHTSNGTSFYIDLKDLEALASGQCSACGKSLPESNQTGDYPRISKSPTDYSADKKVCKSCQPRRRSSEDVFWIPFTDKEKTSIVNRKSCEESEHCAIKTQKNENFRRKAKGSGVERDESLKASDPEKLAPLSREGSDSDPLSMLVAQNNGEEPSTCNQQQFKEVTLNSSEMTGFDVSCVCNNVSGACSCTIVRKEISNTSLAPTEPASQSVKGTFLTESALTFVNADVVKTVGESSSLTGPTVAQRHSDNCASGDSSASTVLDSVKSPTKEHSLATLRSESSGKSVSFSNKLVDSFEASKATESQGQQTLEPQEASSEVDKKQGGVGEKQEPSPPKEAWTSPRKEEPGSGGIKIWNPYPSPLPPEDKSAVHPPIGPASDCRLTSRKGRNGKVKSRKSVGKSKVNTTKGTKPKSKIQSQGQSSKPGKKKAKDRKVPEVKMITVQQRQATEELGLRTISQGGGFDILEDVPCPPTISQSTFPRHVHSRALCGKYTVLSPIPESPRSLVNTPRRVDVPESIHEVGSEVEQQVTVEDETHSASCNSVEDATKDGFDLVDGGFISRLFGKCIPQLKLTSDTESDSESNEPPVNQSDRISQPVAMVSERRTNDNLVIEGERGPQDFVPDEAHDEMEKEIQNQLLRPDTELNSSSFVETENSYTDLTNDQHSEFLGRTNESCIISFKYSTAAQQNLVQAEEEESEPTDTDEKFDRHPVSSRSSSVTTFNSEEYSDTDSSYNSCDSASPRPPSSSSSLNSSDTYFSSPRDSSCAATPTPDHDTYSENSIEIEYFEHMLSRDKSSASSSSDSTVRAQSNTSFGSFQESTDSFSSGNLVRSRLSATSRSQSCWSCEDEIIWKKGNILGRGAFGTVFCGLTNTGEMIAVKQVELNHSNVEEAEKQYEKLQEEVSLLKSLNHENIVRFIGTCFDCGVVNIFMEYVPGGSIASILSRFGCLGESVFCRYTKQLLSGVSYLHGNNVIHRDIKGGNILVMPSGVLKLIDFGCAKRLCLNLSMSKSNILRSMKGTPYWMAPEVIRETGHGRKSDIWSVGCTVYEMATGKPPWSDMPPMAAIFAIGSGSVAVPELGENFSKEARDFVNKCLTRDPDVRPSADELRQHPFLKNPS